MAKKKIFISFDYDNDKNYRYLLSALKENSSVDLDFTDVTPEEIQSYDVSRIKAVLTSKIKSATHTLVIVGKEANKKHPKSDEIGDRNWQWWEINKSHEEGKKFIGVKIDASYDAPEPLLGKGATWARSFKVDSIIEAINDA